MGEPIRLTIVIPALDEEAAIGATLASCVAARAEIMAGAGITDVRLVVVSDGSTDRTAEIARGFPEVELVEFAENRGYGAAIKAGWQKAPSELLAFLDADGTCDPLWLVPMCRRVLDGGAHLVLGDRMGPGSRMPGIRRAGNVMFALLLGHLSRRRVHDTASGIRVVRRDALPRLLPLPDGLHFTPAMSARALMDEEVRIAEIAVPYRERIGRSKLQVVRDGLRFLSVILETAAYVRVSRLTLPLVLALSLLSAAALALPLAFYVAHGRLEEWMLYRVVLAGTSGTMAAVVLCATIVTEHISALILLRYRDYGSRTRGLWRYENLRALLVLAALLGVAAVGLNWRGLTELATTGHVTVHWSRVVLGSFFCINLAGLVSAVATIRIIRALHERQPYLRRREDVASAPSDSGAGRG